MPSSRTSVIPSKRSPSGAAARGGARGSLAHRAFVPQRRATRGRGAAPPRRRGRCAGSVSSIRSSIQSPKELLATALSALPTCSDLVGLGAKRPACRVAPRNVATSSSASSSRDAAPGAKHQPPGLAVEARSTRPTIRSPTRSGARSNCTALRLGDVHLQPVAEVPQPLCTVVILTRPSKGESTVTRSGTGPSVASGCAIHRRTRRPACAGALRQLASASRQGSISVSGQTRSGRSQRRWPMRPATAICPRPASVDQAHRAAPTTHGARLTPPRPPSGHARAAAVALDLRRT